MSRASRRPRHRVPGRARLGAGARTARTAGRAAVVVGLVVLAGAGGAGEGAPGQAGGDRGARPPEAVLAAEAARWDAAAAAHAERSEREAHAVAVAALAAAGGVEPLRISPEPLPALAGLDAAVDRLRAEAAGGATGAADRIAAAVRLQDAAGAVFRGALEVERSAAPPRPVAARPPAVAALADLERTLARVDARAATLVAAGALEVPARPGAARATPGLLRADGTADPATLCPVPFAPGALLRCDAAAALVELNAAFRADHGRDLPVGSTYRTYPEQVALKAAKGALAAPPGTSHHGWGVAVDFAGFGDVGRFDVPLYRWMVDHGPAAGWVHPPEMGPGGSGPAEPWHWEYAGTGR